LTVEELIALLRKADPVARVFVALPDQTWRDIELTVRRWDDSTVLIMTTPPSAAPATTSRPDD
jgi:hypothetical protein